MPEQTPAPRVAIACGGTGGHLFPGLAVAEQLRQHGCAITLLVSPKDVDQRAVKCVSGMEVATLPAVGLTRGSRLRFVQGLSRSYRAAKNLFQIGPPEAVLAMGGFTGAPPVLAAKAFGIPVFLHESNTIPGRANRWLSWVITTAFVGFPETSARLNARRVKVTGTPVRSEFKPLDSAACREAIGLEPHRPVLLITGGSQGASGLNELVIDTLPLLAKKIPELQLFHLTGPNESEKVGRACAASGVHGVVHPFFESMHLTLGAADVAVSRAGASSLAELAAMQVPSILVPYPSATDNHQYFNARAFEASGAAFLLNQHGADPQVLAQKIVELVRNPTVRENTRTALQKWHAPQAAEQIAEGIMDVILSRRRAAGHAMVTPAPVMHDHQSAAT